MATMNTYTSNTGQPTYRVRIRMKGQPIQTASFHTLKDAQRWAKMREGRDACW